MTRAIGYIRVSTKDQGENGFGLMAQRDAIEMYCDAHNLELLTVIPDVVSAAKSSRKTGNMHGRAAAVAAVQAGIADVLVVHALDRASRNPVDGGLLIEQAHEEGWQLLSLDGVDSEDEDQFMTEMRLVFAKQERRKISERTRAGLARAKREGKELGKKSTIPRETINQIVDLRMREGLSAKQIAARLTNARVPTPGGQSVWAHSTVRGVLAREGVV